MLEPIEESELTLGNPDLSETEQAEARLPFTLTHVGIVLFMIAYYVRPTDWIPGAQTVPLAKITAGLAILGFLVTLLANFGAVIREIRQSKVLVGLLILYFYTWFTVPFAYWRGGSFEIVSSVFSEVIVIAGLIYLSTTTTSRLKRILTISILTAVVMSVLAVRSFNTLGAAADESTRVTGALGNVFSNPNDLALNVVILLPFCVILGLLKRGIPRLFWFICSAIMVGGILVSYSRAGFLALLITVVVLCIDLGLKSRVLIILPLVLAVALGAVMFLPSTFGDRISTIVNPAKDQTGSAQARGELLRESLYVTARHPLLGIGPGNFDSVSGSWHGTHNIFTQLSSEAGIPALLIFLWTLRWTFRGLKQAMASSKNNREMTLLLIGSRASMVALIVSTFFYHAAFQFFTYFPIAYAAALFEMSKHIQAEVVEPATEEVAVNDFYGLESER